MSIITVERKVLEKNDLIASELRAEFSKKKIFCINMLSSPGSGKTSIIEKLKVFQSEDLKAAVIAGDVQTDNDAQRIEAADIPVVQIITNGGCHLEASLIREAFHSLNFSPDLLIIENVGNLVCPAGFDLGENIKMIIMSTTEGDDKPLKYPAVFRNSSVMVLNKTDLIPYTGCIPETMIFNALRINPSLKIFKVSCKTGEGFPELITWLTEQIRK